MSTIQSLLLLTSLAVQPPAGPVPVSAPSMQLPPTTPKTSPVALVAVGGPHVQFKRDGWTWVPTLRNGEVESFIALRNDGGAGANLATIWFRKNAGGVWAALSWEDQDQSRAIAKVKATLGLPDASDGAWPVAPSGTAAAEPERVTGGVLASDELATVVGVVAEPAEFVQSLEGAGWRAAWIDVWAQPCPQDAVLQAWAVAVEGVQAVVDAEGGLVPETIDMVFRNSVSQPCGGDSCQRLFAGVGGAEILHESSQGSLRVNGVVTDVSGKKWGVQNGILPPGTIATSAMIQNDGPVPATVLIGSRFAVEVAPGESFAVIDTYSPCSSKCTRLKEVIEGMDYNIPVYCFDPKCYCCCWSSLQPEPPSWLDAIPNCPCNLTAQPGGGFANPNPDLWQDPEPASPTFHPGASHCIRQTPYARVNGKGGQQCCYDAAGHLITVGAGAGTPDIVAPGAWWPLSQVDPVDTLDHWQEDVESFFACRDANMLDCYLRHRPPNNGKGCPCNPPTHPHCTKPPTDASCPCNAPATPEPVSSPVK